MDARWREWAKVVGIAAGAVVAFQVGYIDQRFAFLMVGFAWGLMRVARAPSARGAFWLALVVGVACYGPRLGFFWGIFGAMAVALWVVVALPLAGFVLVHRMSLKLLPRVVAVLGAAAVFTGFEFFRSELYMLRFAWLTPGLAFGNGVLERWCGVYGTGFVVVLVAGVAEALPWWRWMALVAGMALAVVLALPLGEPSGGRPGPMVVGVQTEDASERELLAGLERAVAQYPEADVAMLSEYAIASPPTQGLKAWCRERGKYLVVGGMRPVEGQEEEFENTAFVVDPHGEVCFSQVKSVPIQFFRDGRAAREQRVWESPWGKIGICICYDLSYARVVDRLVEQEAELILAPTMDVENWGAAEHALHGRIAPARAAEYGISIVRVCSSGISQVVDSGGRVIATAGFPGPGAIVAGQTEMRSGRVPADRYVAWGSLGVVGVLMVAGVARGCWLKMRRRRIVPSLLPVGFADTNPGKEAEELTR
jgi:apolipoprotein N-acyltransferase